MNKFPENNEPVLGEKRAVSVLTQSRKMSGEELHMERIRGKKPRLQ